jgi:hypothetical protein
MIFITNFMKIHESGSLVTGWSTSINTTEHYTFPYKTRDGKTESVTNIKPTENKNKLFSQI